MALRSLAEILRRLSGAEYPPRLESLGNLWEKITAGTLGKGMTLAGLKVSAAKNGQISFAPEAGRAAKTAKRAQKPACKKQSLHVKSRNETKELK